MVTFLIVSKHLCATFNETKPNCVPRFIKRYEIFLQRLLGDKGTEDFQNFIFFKAYFWAQENEIHSTNFSVF